MSDNLRKVKLGIIGCGKQASINLTAIKETNLFEVVAICDTDSQKLDSIKGILNETTFFETDNYLELLKNKDVECVMIASPTKFHVEQAIAALKNKKDVFLEKPIGINIEEVDELIKVALESENIVFVGLELDYSYLFNSVREKVSSKEFGSAKYINVSEHRNHFLIPWFYDKSMSGGAINDKLIHHFDIVNSIFYPSQPVSVYAKGFQHKYKKDFKIEFNGIESDIKKSTIVDNAQIIVEYEDEKYANFNLNMYSNLDSVEGTSIYIGGMNGDYIRINNAESTNANIIFKGNSGDYRKYHIGDKSDSDYKGTGHPGNKEQFKQLYKSVVDRKEPKTNLIKVRNAQLIALTAEKSIEEKKEVFISKNLVRNKDIYSNSKINKWEEYSDSNHYEFQLYSDAINDNIHYSEMKKNFLIDKIYYGIRNFFSFQKSFVPRRRTIKIFSRVVQTVNNHKEITENFDSINKQIKVNIGENTYHVKILEPVEFSLRPFEDFDEKKDIEVTISDHTWFQLLNKTPISFLYLTGKIKVKGKPKELQSIGKFIDFVLNQLYIEYDRLTGADNDDNDD